MLWSISLNAYGFCNFGAKIWFNLSLAIIPVLAFIHTEQFFTACSRQQKQKYPCPPTPPLELHLKVFQLSVSWRPGPTSDFRARRRHKQPFLLFLHRELCGTCSQAAHGAFSRVSCVWAESPAQAPRPFCKPSTWFALHFVPIYWNRASHVQTNMILLWGVRGVAVFVDIFFVCLFFFFSSPWCWPSVYEAWSRSICNISS